MSRSKAAQRRARHQPKPLPPIPPQGDTWVGRLNVYSCPADHHTVTVDRDAGVTPSGMLCPHIDRRGFPVVEVVCDLTTRSAFYRVPDGLTPTHEWYRPDNAERRTLNPYKADHVNRGGLLLRPIQPPPAGQEPE